MSRVKRLGIGAGISLAVLGGLTGFWYQRHYTMPTTVTDAIPLPEPNGYDTLMEALNLMVPEYGGVSIRSNHPLTEQDRAQLLKVNAVAIARVRKALTQEYLTRPYDDDVVHGKRSPDLASVLQLAGDAEADRGHLPEAARYYLNAIELGVAVPRGGDAGLLLSGIDSEGMGRAALSELTERLDRKTARAAAERVAAIERERAPFAEILMVEGSRQHYAIDQLFYDGPVAVWRTMGSEYSGLADTTAFLGATTGKPGPKPPQITKAARVLTMQALVTYQGPGPTIVELDRLITESIERSKLPWGPQRPPLAPPSTNLLARAKGPTISAMEFYYRLARTELALLQEKLRLRAEFLETGRYPSTLERLPEDPFSPTRSPLRYKPGSDGKTYTLWSVGPDAKDDGGIPPAMFFGEPRRKPSVPMGTRGDIVA